ncbi:hypothetical protein MASR2M18_06370 [Ignavibacteria bacterium]|nr:hypothetical protein [Bacteroidota bacterium]MCZ2132503.1 hypothetical protein [Bacteroidota bacterium]
MNIAAIKAYSAAAGVRPTLPVRNTITDDFDDNGNGTAQKHAETIGKRYEPAGGKELFALFNASGRLETVSSIKGGIFDGKA